MINRKLQGSSGIKFVREFLEDELKILMGVTIVVVLTYFGMLVPAKRWVSGR